MRNQKLAVVITHPIQYYSPVFKLLSEHTTVKVFYTSATDRQYDPGFGKIIKWDIPLLEGYNHEFLQKSNQCQSIRIFNPTHLLIYGWAHLSHLRILRSFKNKTVICFRGDSNLLKKSNIFKELLRGLALKWVYQHVDLAFYAGSANRSYFLKYGLKEHQLHFAPHAVDNQRFAQQDAEILRKQLGIMPTKTLVLFTGKLNRTKNPLLLLRAFLELKDPNTALLFVGSGDLEYRLKTIYRKSNQVNIFFLPFQNQSKMPAVYHACDLFCMPSEHESWGLAINEAMAAGKAILASDRIGGATDLIKESNGATFKSGCIKDLKLKLQFMTQNKPILFKKGLASKNVIKNWTFQNQVKRIIDGIS